MNRLRISLLGNFAITHAGNPVSGFRSEKVRALLAYLAAGQDRTHSRDGLATLLWGEYDERAARTSLRISLSNLRKIFEPLEDAIGHRLLVVERHQVILRADPALSVDVQEIDRHWAATEAHPHTSLLACGACMDRFAQAVDLYTGPFLAGLLPQDAQQFDEWRTVQQERLHRRVQAMLHALTQHALASQTPQQAEQYARRQIALTPWHEEGHRQLMQALAAQGLRAQALDQFEKCREILAQELGIEPAVETTALFTAIKSGQMAPAASTSAPQNRLGLPTARHNLPAQLTPFFGRSAEIAEILARISNPNDRLLCLVGLGGAGKTRLALAAGERLLAAFPGGVWFVPLASIDEEISAPASSLEDALAGAISQALGLQLHSPDAPLAHLQRQLANRQALLILDSIEHLLEGTAGAVVRDLILELLSSAPGLKILVTSRQRLMLQAESVLLVEGLEIPAEDGLENARDAHSVQMFSERARRVVGNFDPGAELACIVQLCRFVQGLPLAIELAATWALHYTCREIIDQMDSLDIFSTALHDVPDRHRSIRMVFERSWELLSAEEQRVLLQASIFRGSFSRQAALAVTDGSIRELAALVDKSLLRRLAGGRYQLHELLRQFVLGKRREQLDRQESHQLQGRYRSYFLTLLHENESALNSRAAKQAVTALHQDLDNIRRAWQFGLEQADLTGLSDSLRALCLFYTLDGLFREGEALLERSAASLQRQQPGEDPAWTRLLARMQTERALLQNRQGRLDAAQATAERAVALAQSAGHAESQILARSHMGYALWRQGQTAPAQAILQEAGEIAEAAQRQDLASYVRARLGALALMQGGYDESRRAFEDYLRFCRNVGDLFEESLVRNNLGYIYHALREYSPAQAYFEQSLAIKRELGVRQGMGNTLVNLGVIALTVGQYAQAHSRYQQALAFSRELGDQRLEGLALSNLSLFYAETGQFEESVEAARLAERIHAQVGDRPTLGYIHTHLGHGLAGLGRLDEAEAAYQRAVQLHEEMDQPNPKAETLAGLADLHLRRGDPAAACRAIAALIDDLLAGSLVGTLRPFRVYLLCYRALRAQGDERAGAVLGAGQGLLHEAAAKISDPEQRRSFLQDVSFHLALAEEPAPLPKNSLEST